MTPECKRAEARTRQTRIEVVEVAQAGMGQNRERSEIATDECSRVQPKLPGPAETESAGPCWEALLLKLADRAMG